MLSLQKLISRDQKILAELLHQKRPKKGSKKNKPDSAKDGKGKITFSKEVTAQLSAKVKEHNAKGKGSKATLGMLKAVYRRGAGAFSTSHAPKMSRHGWAIAQRQCIS